MLMGWPVHEPNIHRTGDPASSHSSKPTRLHVVPPFVHDADEEFDVAAADAALNVMTVPPEL